MSIEVFGGCPCKYVEPCQENCSCVSPMSSHGCLRCCRYGSIEQRTSAAKRIATPIDENASLHEQLKAKDEDIYNTNLTVGELEQRLEAEEKLVTQYKYWHEHASKGVKYYRSGLEIAEARVVELEKVSNPLKEEMYSLFLSGYADLWVPKQGSAYQMMMALSTIIQGIVNVLQTEEDGND